MRSGANNVGNLWSRFGHLSDDRKLIYKSKGNLAAGRLSPITGRQPATLDDPIAACLRGVYLVLHEHHVVYTFVFVSFSGGTL